jgi:hypothetical protein
MVFLHELQLQDRLRDVQYAFYSPMIRLPQREEYLVVFV